MFSKHLQEHVLIGTCQNFTPLPHFDDKWLVRISVYTFIGSKKKILEKKTMLAFNHARLIEATLDKKGSQIYKI